MTRARHKRQALFKKALEWRKQNPWFGKDIEKTNKALDVHVALLESGIRADSDDYYRELDAVLAKLKEKNT